MTPLGALQATLAGEHAAYYVYGVLGGQVSHARQPALAALIHRGYAEHRLRRDRLSELIAGQDAQPVAAEPGYQLPNGLSTPAELRAAARQVEARCLMLYGQLVQHSAGAARAWAISTLNLAAVQQLGLGMAPANFPGATG